MDIFFAFNQEVEYRDLKNPVLYPPEIKQQRDRNMSYNTTSISEKRKGGDFLLEEKVKRQKLIAPKGQTISRSLDEFDEIYSASFPCLNVNGADFAPKKDIAQEIFEWRAV